MVKMDKMDKKGKAIAKRTKFEAIFDSVSIVHHTAQTIESEEFSGNLNTKWK